jgi:Cobalamin-independent synthase, N-terminal domain
MFATLLGPLPRPSVPEDAPIESIVDAVIEAQLAAGLDPVTDGGHGDASDPVAAWRLAAARTDRIVKQALIGPFSYGVERSGRGANANDRTDVTLARATELADIVHRLADAGCPMVEIHEPAAVTIGSDGAERALFRGAHERLAGSGDGIHLGLAVTGGSADRAGIETILSGPYASLAVDLIRGPDNWRLVAVAPHTVGIICGALSPAAGSDDGPETLLWAVGYAASTQGRGPQRVGLATAASLAHLPWPAALAKMERLGAAARLADQPVEARVRGMDPRAVSIRAAALGRVEPRPSRGPDRDREPT